MQYAILSPWRRHQVRPSVLLIIRIQSHIVLLYINIIVPSFNVTHNNFYVEATHSERCILEDLYSYFYYYNVIIAHYSTSIILITIIVIAIINCIIFLLIQVATTTRTKDSPILIVVGRAKRDPPPNHLGLDFHIIGIYTYAYVRF